MTKKDHVKIFDTTLRDGEQCPGATMTLPEKLRVAKQLELLNVDIPGSSVHCILQGRILEWAACPPPGDLPNLGI